MKNKKTGDKIKELRKELNLSQVELSHLSGVDRSHISKLENDKLPGMRLTTWTKIMNALKKYKTN